MSDDHETIWLDCPHFSRAKGFAAYCRSSAFDQSDGPMLALEFEGLASALAKHADVASSDEERANLAKSVQDAAMSLGSTDEWTDHNSMIGDFEDRFSALKNERDESRLANTDLAEQLEKSEAAINRMMGSATAARKDFDETFTRMQAAEQRAKEAEQRIERYASASVLNDAGWKAERDAALARIEKLEAAFVDLLENVEEPPDRNCSCHISPPCNDCVDYGGLRGALKEARAALKLAKD